MQTTTFRYNLDKTSKKFTCPQCLKKRFVKVIDAETREYLPDHVGRCDRENGCGYEYRWSDWAKDARPVQPRFKSPEPVEPPEPVNYLPLFYLERTLKHYEQNNFYLFLSALFTEKIASRLCAQYLIGTSKLWKGATIFPQIDTEGNLRQLKIMLHNPTSGKRIKEGATVERYNKQTGTYERITTDRPCSLIYGKFIDERTRHLNLQQFFFGQHLLAEYPEKEVCITESEKTAMIASIYLPQFIWMATGGASGCKWRDYETYKVLRGRSVTFFPDYGLFNKKTGKTCYQEWVERVERIQEAIPGKIRVSGLLEERLSQDERQDQDLADLLLTRDKATGIALTDAGYPVIWDYRP